MNVDKQEVIELLKTGNFTLNINDNGWCALYRGKVETDSNDEYEHVPYGEAVYHFNIYDDCVNSTDLIDILIEALGGKFVVTP